MTWGNSLKQQQKSIAWKGKYYISTRSKRVSSTEIKFVFNNGSVLSHLIESSTPFRDVSNVKSMPEGHCHCTTNETKPGLKIKMQMKWTFQHLPISSTPTAKLPKKTPKQKGQLTYGILQSKEGRITCLNRLGWHRTNLVFGHVVHLWYPQSLSEYLCYISIPLLSLFYCFLWKCPFPATHSSY